MILRMIRMHGQTYLKVIGIIFWVVAILLIMATYGVFGKPLLEQYLSKGFLERASSYYNSSPVLIILLLTIGTFLIIYPFKK